MAFTLPGGVTACACQHFGVTTNGITHRFQQLDLFVPAEGGGFTGGAAHQQSVGSLIHKMTRQTSGKGKIHRSLCIERGHHGREQTAKGGWERALRQGS